MKEKLNYLSERQSVLAQNIANADTPNYHAQDVTEPNFAKMVDAASAQKLQGSSSGKLQMAVTDPQHITGAKNTGHFAVVDRKATAELNPDGNNVVIEEEMAKIGQNQAEYQKVLNMYGKMITMFKTAIGNGQGSG